MKYDGIRDRLNSALPDVDASERELVSPTLLTSITERMSASMAPVRALPATWVLVTVLVIATAGAATAGAAILGMAGLRTMSGGAAFLILSSAICFGVFAAVTCVQLGIPGSRIIV